VYIGDRNPVYPKYWHSEQVRRVASKLELVHLYTGLYTFNMEGLVTAAAAAAHGATTPAPPPGLTFTYTPADIQGLADTRGGGIHVAGQQHLQHGHGMVQGPGQQRLSQQIQGTSPRIHVGNTSGIAMSGGARTSKLEEVLFAPMCKVKG
jgi:hypothetical protein